MTQPSIAHTALPMEYSIDAVPASPDWIYELRWNGARLDTFYSIGDAVDAGIEHAGFVAGGYFDDDCAAGDIHSLWPCCSDGMDFEAACYLAAFNDDGTCPVQCPGCKAWHLKVVITCPHTESFYSYAEAALFAGAGEPVQCDAGHWHVVRPTVEIRIAA